MLTSKSFPKSFAVAALFALTPMVATAGNHSMQSAIKSAKRAHQRCLKQAKTRAERQTCDRNYRRTLKRIDRQFRKRTVSEESKPAAQKAPRTKRSRRIKAKKLDLGRGDLFDSSKTWGKASKSATRGTTRTSKKMPARRRPPIYKPNVVDIPQDRSGPAQNNTKAVKTNALIETSKQHTSTFAADVDTGSYTFSRRKLISGLMPSKSVVRVEEFLNYFTYDYATPAKGPFAIHMEAAPSPFVAQKNRYVMRVGIQAKKLTAKTRKPVHLTFLVDVSGSMNRHDKLGLAKDALKILTNNLRKGDTVAIATYASGSKILLQPTSIDKKATILEGIKALRAGGSTNMSDGLTNAYKLALTNFKRNHVNRIVVLSDGDANVGGSSQQEIYKTIKKYIAEGVTLSTIGFGMGDYRDNLMEHLANKGNGNYYYIDTIAEAKKVFESQLDGTLQVIAKDVKLQLEFNPKVVKAFRLIGYENRHIANKDFRNDQVDAGEVGAGHQVTALYEVITHGAPKGLLATMRVRHKKPDGYKAEEVSTQMMSTAIVKSLNKASKDFQFATGVAAFAEILRGSPYAKKLNYDLVAEVAKVGVGLNQPQRAEFLKLVKNAKKIQSSQALYNR